MTRHPSLIPLSHDHHHGLALALRCRKQALGQLKPLGAEGLRERAREVREFFATKLVLHFRAEEEVLFPYLRSLAPECHAIIEQLTADHEDIRRANVELEREMSLGKVLFDLGDLLERHIRKEERELFTLFEQQVEHADADAVVIGEEIKKILAGPSA
jgi:hemerythrin-like domain-containing protein